MKSYKDMVSGLTDSALRLEAMQAVKDKIAMNIEICRGEMIKRGLNFLDAYNEAVNQNAHNKAVNKTAHNEAVNKTAHDKAINPNVHSF